MIRAMAGSRGSSDAREVGRRQERRPRDRRGHVGRAGRRWAPAAWPGDWMRVLRARSRWAPTSVVDDRGHPGVTQRGQGTGGGRRAAGGAAGRGRAGRCRGLVDGSGPRGGPNSFTAVSGASSLSILASGLAPGPSWAAVRPQSSGRLVRLRPSAPRSNATTWDCTTWWSGGEPIRLVRPLPDACAVRARIPPRSDMSDDRRSEPHGVSPRWAERSSEGSSEGSSERCGRSSSLWWERWWPVGGWSGWSGEGTTVVGA